MDANDTLGVRRSRMLQQVPFWLALGLIIAVSAISFQSTRNLLTGAQWVDHTQSVLRELDGLLSDIVDVESGARGYVITGERRYLAPFIKASTEVPRSLSRLRSLTNDNATQQRRLVELSKLSTQRVAAARHLIASREEVIRTGISPHLEDGLEVMNRSRALIAAMSQSEKDLYASRRANLERTARIANTALLTGVALSLVALIWLFGNMLREIRGRSEAEASLRMLNAGQETRIAKGVAETRRSAALLNTVIESIPDMIFMKDANDLRFLLINRAGERLIGKEREVLLGRTDAELFPGSEADAFIAKDREVLSSGKPLVIAEERLTTESGVRLLETRKIPVLDDQGTAAFVLGVSRDITEQRVLEEQLRRSQRMEAVGQLTGGMAHDFNNLLTIIIGNAELLNERTCDADMKEFVDEVLGAALRGSDLVRRLLAFSRRQRLTAEPINLNERLPEITNILQRTLGERIKVVVSPGDDVWPALVDPTQVDVALLNLAINARDAMPNGGVLTVETRNVTLDEAYAAQEIDVRPGEYVMLAVSDTGAGMPEEVAVQAFEPFFTTKETDKGTGLGLSMVYGWTKQSGGHAKIYSEVGHGTTVKLYLPRAQASEAAAEMAPELEGLLTGHEHILVVEDNPGVRQLVLRQLAELGYTTVAATNAEEALKILNNDLAVDLLFTDVVMPGDMTGFELAEVARQARPTLCVLFSSGYTQRSVGNGHSRRFEGQFISKPYRKQDLAKAVRDALR